MWVMDEALLKGVARVDQIARVAAPADGEAFEWLTDAHLDRAYRLAWAILGDDAEAQDATQDAFATAWRSRANLRDPAKVEAWLSRILINGCRDRLRRRGRNRVQPLEAAPLPHVPDGSQQASARDELDRALAGLDPDHRIVVILRFWADLTVDDIAGRLGVPSGTVKSRLHHSMRALRAALEEAR
jgi:RNA polymerase sigma-70 factor (ECF subfamily)